MRNIIEYQDLIWVDIIEPTAEDIEYLGNNFRLHPLTLKTIIPTIHHPDLEIFRNYLFIILHHPDSEKKENMEIQELDIIAGKDYLITSHYKIIKPLNSIFEECLKSPRTKEEYLKRGIGHLLFVILKQLLKEKLNKIDELEDEIDLVENEIFLGKEKEIIKRISLLKRKILTFWRVLEPQRMIFDSLKNVGPKLFGLDFKPHFFVLFRIQREIEDTIKNSKETIESLERTNHILVTVRLDEVIKILTIFSAIILPLTLLASIWGMNVSIPFAKNPFGFWLIVLLMLITVGVTIAYFKTKKWL
ncbi:magnesium transporter CorA family protein [Patescibacteria group bacterium]|nr:magnesium transporter CorA family protein [Patescibacteria group bacterium]MBU4481419.1 magnesium transporter CorA family protein [Patescibacteria group bacterium]